MLITVICFVFQTRFVASLSAVPLTNDIGLADVFWLACGVCCASFITMMAYIQFEGRVLKGRKDTKVYGSEGRSTLKEQLHHLFNMPILVWLLFLQGFAWFAVWKPFEVNCVNRLQKQYGYDQTMAGFVSSTNTALGIVLPPLAGLLMDFTGRRTIWVFVSSAFMLSGISIIAYAPSVPVYIPLAFMAISQSVGEIAALTSFTLLLSSIRKDTGRGGCLNTSLLSTAYSGFGVCSTASALISLTGMGYIQDSTVGLTYKHVTQIEVYLSIFALVVSSFCIVRVYVFQRDTLCELSSLAWRRAEKVKYKPKKSYVKAFMVLFLTFILAGLVFYLYAVIEPRKKAPQHHVKHTTHH